MIEPSDKQRGFCVVNLVVEEEDVFSSVQPIRGQNVTST